MSFHVRSYATHCNAQHVSIVKCQLQLQSISLLSLVLQASAPCETSAPACQATDSTCCIGAHTCEPMLLMGPHKSHPGSPGQTKVANFAQRPAIVRETTLCSFPNTGAAPIDATKLYTCLWLYVCTPLALP